LKARVFWETTHATLSAKEETTKIYEGVIKETFLSKIQGEKSAITEEIRKKCDLRLEGRLVGQAERLETEKKI